MDVNSRIINDSLLDSNSEQFRARSRRFQENSYEFRKTIATIPAYQNVMISAILDHCNGLNVEEVEYDLSNFDRCGGRAFAYQYPDVCKRKLSGIIHDFNYSDPKILRTNMGRHAPADAKMVAELRFKSMCDYISESNRRSDILFLRHAFTQPSVVDSDDSTSQLTDFYSRNALLSEMFSQITPTRSYCLLSARVNSLIMSCVKNVRDELYSICRDVHQRFYSNSCYVSKEFDLQQLYVLLSSKNSSRRRARFNSAVCNGLLGSKAFTSNMALLGFPVYRPSHIHFPQLVKFLDLVTLEEKIKNFRNEATRYLPKKILREINSYVNQDRRTNEMISTMLNECQMEIMTIMDQWNTELDLLQFSHKTIQRVIREEYLKETKAVSGSINNKKARIRSLLQRIVDSARCEGQYVTDAQARQILITQLQHQKIGGITARDVQNYQHTDSSVESLEQRMDVGLELSNGMSFEDQFETEHRDDSLIMEQICGSLSYEERVIITQLLTQSERMSSKKVESLIKRLVADQNSGLTTELVQRIRVVAGAA